MKILVILGPTSSGKSDVAIKLAKKFNGEVISADSRQIYRGLDIGTGKATGALAPVVLSGAKDLKSKNVFISEGIPHYMIDVVSPRTNFSAAQFKKKADKIIADILKRNKLPIICGGTGFWIKAIVDNVTYPEVKPDPVLRNVLRNKTRDELFTMLKKLDSERAKTIDKNNPVRLIRAIEICKTLGKVPPPSPVRHLSCRTTSPLRGEVDFKSPSRPHSGEMLRTRDREGYEFIQIGIKLSKEKLHANIKKRLKKRFQEGMIEEVEKLHETGLSWKKIKSFGLGYKLIPEYLRKEVYPVKSRKAGAKLFNRELFEHIYQAEKDYAKRQMTWFKKDKRIVWLEKYGDMKKEVKKFLS
jgi:tRNA dimethylallyltransferase